MVHILAQLLHLPVHILAQLLILPVHVLAQVAHIGTKLLEVGTKLLDSVPHPLQPFFESGQALDNLPVGQGRCRLHRPYRARQDRQDQETGDQEPTWHDTHTMPHGPESQRNPPPVLLPRALGC